jgi:hypothetical protein
MSFFSFIGRNAGFNALSALDDRRLSDLGLARFDLADARRKGKATGSFLTERRSERAGAWLR